MFPVSGALQVGDATHAASSPNAATPTTVKNLSHQDQLKDSHNNDYIFTSECPAGCKDGWLSSRMKFILNTVAAVASDLVLDTGEFAEEFGHVGGVYLTDYIPSDELPRGKKAASLWVEGFATIFGVIHDMFEAGDVPYAHALFKVLDKLPENKLKLVQAYESWTEVESALEALVQGAKKDWEEDFEDIHCDEWDALPECTKHDFDWSLVGLMLAD